MGKAIEPAVKPLGWDWRIGCAVIASFPAREVVVATLGVVYGLGEKIETKSEETRQALGSRLAARDVGRDRPEGIHRARGAFDHGLLRALLPVRGDAWR